MQWELLLTESLIKETPEGDKCEGNDPSKIARVHADIDYGIEFQEIFKWSDDILKKYKELRHCRNYLEHKY